MSPIRCQILYRSTSSHLQQLHTGFLSLARQGVITLSQRRRTTPIRHAPAQADFARGAAHAHLDVLVDESLRLHFDTHDAADIALGELDEADAYFKRSYSPRIAAALGPERSARLHPLGLNYRVLPDGLDLQGAWRALRRVDGSGSASRLARLLEALDAFDLTGFRPRESRLCADPDCGGEPRVLFLVAAYDPHDEAGRSAAKVADREYLNEMRSRCIRALRAELGPRFLGGFADSPFARRRYPDLLAPVGTSQADFVALLRSHPVCVATTGLHGSTGWKLAEYVACARAIVSERPGFAVPGDFREGRNYLGFTTVADCVAAAVRLVEDAGLRGDQMQANADYYRRYLRPDRLVLGALQVALAQSGRRSSRPSVAMA